ncbi:hypothetical protein CRUP_023914 [Coryphaenoides rupestris]|nr:hypothetical protein CRUP_023914 [Coryphaenoides rupestris]
MPRKIPCMKLTKVLNFYVAQAEDPALAERLYSALKALKYLFRFIVQSRVLYLRFYGNSEDGDAFFNSIRNLFLSFNTLMDRPLDEGVKIKGAILKYLPSIINDVQTVFDPVELSFLLTKFIGSIPEAQLVRQKLGCMCKMVESDLFQQPDCRDALLPLVTDQLSGQLDDRSSKPDHEACVQLLSTVLDNLDRKDVVRADLMGNVFPADWMVMNLLQMKVFLRAIKQYSELWINYFHLTVAFLTHKTLQLETFSREKRNKILNKYGDMRLTVGFKMGDMWYNLGPHKMKFIPAMVGPVLQATLVPEPELRKATIPIFFDMMQCEHNFSPGRTFQTFENELITKLDQEVEGGRGDEQYKLLLEKTLLEHCRRHRYLDQSGEELALLLSKLLQREEERGHLHSWSDKPCAPHLIPRDGQHMWTQQELKERLFQEIICYLDKGKLAKMHETHMFDFMELSQLLKQQAQFFENIMHAMRPQPEYFAVGYYGLGFPSFLRNKTFIYRGKEYEWLEDFSQKMLSQFPIAVRMTSTAPPGDSILNSPGQRRAEEISPLANAYQACDRSLPVHPLSMMLNGIVDPAVQGGFSNYEKAFFTSTYIHEHPEDLERIEVLKQLIALQVPLLADGIRIHGEKSTEQLKPLHNRLLTCFADLREKVEKLYGVITLVSQARPPPSPAPKLRPHPLMLTQRKGSRAATPRDPPLSWSHQRANLCCQHIIPSAGQQSAAAPEPPEPCPCSLAEAKKGRVGSVVVPYIMSSTLRRMSTVSVLSSASASGVPSQEYDL